jgi:hypothetical protein
VLTAQYAPSPYIKQICFILKGLIADSGLNYDDVTRPSADDVTTLTTCEVLQPFFRSVVITIPTNTCIRQWFNPESLQSSVHPYTKLHQYSVSTLSYTGGIVFESKPRDHHHDRWFSASQACSNSGIVLHPAEIYRSLQWVKLRAGRAGVRNPVGAK